MANESKRISVSELDFDQIKSNLKSFLQAQDQFSDYDFDGSGLSILLDVLAYNTHYNALYTNLVLYLLPKHSDTLLNQRGPQQQKSD